jgi:probable rRNA maturation factor
MDDSRKALALWRGRPHCHGVQIHVFNRQRRVRLDAARLRRFAELALAECARHSGDGLFSLRQMPVVEVAVVSDALIARVHEQFMGIAGATDVITFEHGEIVVSADTAAALAAEHGHDALAELGLYIVHGLLHLNGFDDREPRDRARMHRAQERIWKAVRVQLFPPRTSAKTRAGKNGGVSV